MRRIALKNKIGIILLGGGLILAALGAALFCGSAGAGFSAEAAVGGETMTGVCPGCGKHGATYRVMAQATCTTGLRQSISHAECGYFGSTEGDPLGHDYGEYIETKAPTCTEAGSETAECSRCGDTTTRTGDAALGHTPGAAATCTEEQTCTVCGAELAPALGHDWKDEMSYDETMHWTGCSRCDAKYENTIGIPDDKLKHTPGPAATCTDAQTCTVCGMEITAVLGHDPVADAAVDPTCTATGLTAGSHCARCDTVLQAQEEISALGHDYGEYVETTAPTCTKDGEETSSCSRCNDVRTRAVDALGHDPESDNISATCTSSGTSGRTVCSRCGVVVNSGTTVPALGHSYGSYTTVTPATCTLGGRERATCTRCGDTTTRSTSALGHNMTSSYVSATCTSGGYTYNYCTRCSYSYNSDQTSALGHNYGTYTTSKAPTCTATGTETAKCTRCSATTSRTLAALGHDYGEYVETTAPTCTAAGEEEAECSRCGERHRRSPRPGTSWAPGLLARRIRPAPCAVR